MIIGKDIQDMLTELEHSREQKDKEQDALYRENRGFRRSRVVWEAKLKVYFNDVTLKGDVREVAGIVRDISANGAKVDLKEPLMERIDLELHIPKLGVFPCNIVWQDNERVGLQFKESPETVFTNLIQVLPNA